MATFIEENIRTRVDILRSTFQREYSEVYAAWAEDPIQSKLAVYDTERCWQMVEIADKHLEQIARNYPRRFLIKLLRSLPLDAIKHLMLIHDRDGLVRHILAATAAAWRFGNTTLGGLAFTSEKENVLTVTPDQWEFIRKNCGQDIARFLGAIHARLVGETSYRVAGKGLSLLQPEKVQPEDWAKFQKYPTDGFLVVPCPTFQPSAKIQWCIDLYERRKESERSSGTSGFGVPRSDDLEDRYTWLRVTIPHDEEKLLAIQVCYPAQDRTILTLSYFAVPEDTKAYLDLVKDFRSEFVIRFGFDVDSFEVLCEALFRAIFHETAYWELEFHTAEIFDGVWCFRSRLEASDPRADTAPGHLYGLFARAAVTVPRAGYLRHLEKALHNKQIPDPALTAARFLDRFSMSTLEEPGLKPFLFYFIDDATLMLDGLLLNNFFELCLREVTNGDGKVGNQRARLFEPDARSRISKGLGLEPSKIPFAPNRELHDAGHNYGDVDFAFIWNGVLINLDMKSWQRSSKYLKGEFAAIDNRQKDLQAYLSDRVEPRGEKLLEILNRHDRSLQLTYVLDFLCVEEKTRNGI
jgi:hypothetical protein